MQGKGGYISMQGNIVKMLKLIKENPDLPIIPMVDAEIVGDDSGYWLGSIGEVFVDKYVLHEDYGAIFYDNDDPDITDIFEKFFDYAECGIDEEIPDSEAFPLMKQKIDTLDWQRAIIVYIKLPEQEAQYE